jgi:hypothetical protein
MPNCYCLEFSFAKVSEYDLTYTNCSGNTVTETFLSGTTYNICSQDLDPITSCLDIVFEVKGLCIDGDCPQQLIKYQNECDVITIFPMGVQCYVTQPTNSITYNGSASLQITGGTPPYQVMWDNGNISTTISNLGPGSYGSTVVDFYGDFTANTICVLTGVTISPTPTPTPTPTPIPTFGDLCLIIKSQIGKTPFIELHTFIYNGYVNGKPSWISDDTLYTIEWSLLNNQWEVTGWSIGLSAGSLVNTNPIYPPLTGWESLGFVEPYFINEVTVSEGDCDSLDILRYDLTVNQPTCGNDGSIIFNVIDGVPPYQYSVNGLTYFNSPIFNGLGSGYYPTSVIDASGQTFVISTNISPAPPPQTYLVSLSLNVVSNLFIVSVTPSLPLGVSLTFDLVHTSNLIVAPTPGAATYNNVVTVNVNSVSTPYSTTYSSGTSTLLTSMACPGGTQTNTITTNIWNNLTMVQGTTINGTVTNLVTAITPSDPCYVVNNGYGLVINNARIVNCPCCLLTIKNPPSYSTGKVTVG